MRAVLGGVDVDWRLWRTRLRPRRPRSTLERPPRSNQPETTPWRDNSFDTTTAVRKRKNLTL